MSTTALSRSVALRVLRATPGRTTVIALTIAIPTGFAVAAVAADWTGSFGASVAALAITAAIVIVARSSAEPTSVASVAAWQAAGADPFTATRSRRDALRLLGWWAVLVGAIVGLVIGASFADAGPDWALSVVLVLALALVVFTSAAVAWRTKPRRRRLRRLVPSVRYAVSLLLAAAFVALAFGGSLGVKTDLDALLAVPMCATFVTAALLLAQPALRAAVLAAVRLVPSARGISVLTERHRGRLLVRAVVVVSFVVAAVAAVFGSSVAGRDHEVPGQVAEVNNVPRVPANVMAVTFPPWNPYQPGFGAPTSNPESPPAFTPDQITALGAHYPDSQVVPVRILVGEKATEANFLCFLNSHCGAPLIVSDPRLDSVYGHPPAPSESFHYGWNAETGNGLPILVALSAPEGHDVAKAYIDGARLPSASWDDLNFLQVGEADAARITTSTAVRTVFLTRNTPYTGEERQWLDDFAIAADGDGNVSAVTSDDDSPGFASGAYGEAPWAPVSPSTRWSITLIAAVFALIAVVGTSSVAAIDRWRDNERLEVLGASPIQLRLAAALHTWIELGLTALLAVGLTVALLALGISEFNRSATFPVPFTVPWTQVVFLVAVIPAVGTAVAALVARPLRVRDRGPSMAVSH